MTIKESSPKWHRRIDTSPCHYVNNAKLRLMSAYAFAHFIIGA